MAAVTHLLYDETPLPVRTVTSGHASLPSLGDISCRTSKTSQGKKQKGLAKVVQTEASVLLMFKTAQGGHMSWHLPVSTPLVSMDR